MLAIALAAGIALGALVGGLVGALNSRQPTADALLQLTPPSSAPLTALGGEAPSEAGIEDYVAGELAYLSGSAVQRSVQERLGLDSVPEFTATQEATSPVARLTGVADSPDEAVRVVQAAVDAYAERRAGQAAQRTAAALDSVDVTLGEAVGSGDMDDPELRNRINRLQDLRLDVQLQSGRDAAVEVIDPPTAAPSTGAPQWTLGALLGGAVGGLGAAGAIISRRNWSRRLMNVEEVAGTAGVERVLHPALPLGLEWNTQGTMAERQRQLAGLLLAQVARGRPMAGRVIVVAGASSASGSEAVAAAISAAAAELCPVERRRVVAGCPLGEPETGCLIVDGGSLADSPGLPDALRQASDVLLAFRTGVDGLSEAVTLATVANDGPARISAVLTTAPWFTLRRMVRRG